MLYFAKTDRGDYEVVSRRKNEKRDLRKMTITAPEAAAFLGTSERSFYRLVEAGIIPKVDEGVYFLVKWSNHIGATSSTLKG